MELLYDNLSFSDCGFYDLKKSQQGIVFRINNQSEPVSILKTPSSYSGYKRQILTINKHPNQQIIAL